MNPAQLKAQIDAAAAQAYERGRAEGTQIAINKARSFMPTALANAHKQGVMDTARFFKDMSERGESPLDLEEAADQLVRTGEVFQTVWLGGGFKPISAALEPGIYNHGEAEECNPGTLGAGYASE